MTKIIPLLNEDGIEKMKVAGQLASEVLQMLDSHIKAGVSTGFLDDLAYKHITATLIPCVPPLTMWSVMACPTMNAS